MSWILPLLEVPERNRRFGVREVAQRELIGERRQSLFERCEELVEFFALAILGRPRQDRKLGQANTLKHAQGNARDGRQPHLTLGVWQEPQVLVQSRELKRNGARVGLVGEDQIEHGLERDEPAVPS